jgi:uncharacterized membrane protein YfhO
VVSINRWTPNRITLTAKGPGRLVLSELMYPGWIAWVDGQQVGIEEYQGILRSIRLAGGEHEIIFEFRPLNVYLGLLICFAAMGLLGFAYRREEK